MFQKGDEGCEQCLKMIVNVIEIRLKIKIFYAEIYSTLQIYYWLEL